MSRVRVRPAGEIAGCCVACGSSDALSMLEARHVRAGAEIFQPFFDPRPSKLAHCAVCTATYPLGSIPAPRQELQQQRAGRGHWMNPFG